MQIQLSDFKDGKPIIFKGSTDIIEKIRELKKQKKYNEMLELSLQMPTTKDAYLFRANALLHLKEWNKLIDCCNNGLALDQMESQFYNLKGKGFGKLGNQQQKIELLKQAIQLNSSIPAYHRNLGAAYYSIKDYQNAIACHTTAIDLQPASSINYHNKGAAYFRNHHYEQAKQCFRTAIEKDPKLALSYSWLGDCEKQMDRKRQAIVMYGKAYEISGNVIYLKEKEVLMKKIKDQRKEGSNKEEDKKSKWFFGLFGS